MFYTSRIKKNLKTFTSCITEYFMFLSDDFMIRVWYNFNQLMFIILNILIIMY